MFVTALHETSCLVVNILQCRLKCAIYRSLTGVESCRKQMVCKVVSSVSVHVRSVDIVWLQLIPEPQAEEILTLICHINFHKPCKSFPVHITKPHWMSPLTVFRLPSVRHTKYRYQNGCHYDTGCL